MFTKTLLLLAVLSTQSLAQNISADEIIKNYVDALGGYEQLAKIKSLKMAGIYTYRGWDYPLTIIRLRPDFCHFEIDKGAKKEIFIFDGKATQEIDAQTGKPVEIRDPRIRNFTEMLADFDGAVIDYKRKGHQVKLTGEENVDGKPAHKLEVALKNGKTEFWFFDKSSHLLLKRTSKYGPGNRESVQMVYFMDYKAVDGVMLPHYIERNDNHYVNGYEIGEIEVNIDLNERDFTRR
ncbi:MAG: hypothetical protein ACE5I1_14725 [bacterium]